MEAVVIAAEPSQQKLEAGDLAMNDRCQWCHAEVGSHMHRHWRCDCTRQFRLQNGMPPAVSNAAAKCRDLIDELALFEWSRAMHILAPILILRRAILEMKI